MTRDGLHGTMKFWVVLPITTQSDLCDASFAELKGAKEFTHVFPPSLISNKF